jgi:hypothetical protein
MIVIAIAMHRMVRRRKWILCRLPDYAALSFDFPAFVQRIALAMRHNPVI